MVMKPRAVLMKPSSILPRTCIVPLPSMSTLQTLPTH